MDGEGIIHSNAVTLPALDSPGNGYMWVHQPCPTSTLCRLCLYTTRISFTYAGRSALNINTASQCSFPQYFILCEQMRGCVTCSSINGDGLSDSLCGLYGMSQ